MRNDLQAFLDSLTDDAVPTGYSDLLQSVWLGLKGAWHESHEIAQELPGRDAAWIHAWLHRIEGDQGNAHYWYRLAGREPVTGDTRGEGEAIAARLVTAASTHEPLLRDGA